MIAGNKKLEIEIVKGDIVDEEGCVVGTVVDNEPTAPWKPHLPDFAGELAKHVTHAE